MWIFLSLIVAFLCAVQDILNKRATQKCDVFVVAWAWWFFSLPLLYGMLTFEKIPAVGDSFWTLALISVFILTITVVLYIHSLKSSDLSLALPMLSFTPVFLLVTSPLMLNEHPTKIGIVGVLCIVMGAYVLLYKKSKNGFAHILKAFKQDKGVVCMLLVALFFSISGNMDKLGVTNSSPFFWILVLNTMVACATFIVMIFKSRNIYKQIISCWPLLLIIGTCNGLALIVQMNTLKLTLVPYIIAIKRMSVVFAALYGLIVLKEQGFQKRMVGVSLMVGGVFLISFLG